MVNAIDGLAKHFTHGQEREKIDMMGRLRLDICEQDKLIVNNVDAHPGDSLPSWAAHGSCHPGMRHKPKFVE